MSKYEMKLHEFGGDMGSTMLAYTLDGGYIGDEKMAIFLTEKRGIVPEVQPGHDVCNIGFSEQDQEWCGWSHRAIFGFGVGSKVKKGDCAYQANTPEGLIEQHVEFFGDISPSEEKNQKLRNECQVLPDGSGIRIMQAPLIIPMARSLDEAIDGLENGGGGCETVDLHEGYHEVKCGRGEWTAKTMEDAKLMAIDFAEGVS